MSLATCFEISICKASLSIFFGGGGGAGGAGRGGG